MHNYASEYAQLYRQSWDESMSEHYKTKDHIYMQRLGDPKSTVLQICQAIFSQHLAIVSRHYGRVSDSPLQHCFTCQCMPHLDLKCYRAPFRFTSKQFTVLLQSNAGAGFVGMHRDNSTEFYFIFF